MLTRILYSSRSLCDPAETMSLIEHARRANARREVTSALHLTTDGTFFQYLEGQRETVLALIENI